MDFVSRKSGLDPNSAINFLSLDKVLRSESPPTHLQNKGNNTYLSTEQHITDLCVTEYDTQELSNYRLWHTVGTQWILAS